MIKFKKYLTHIFIVIIFFIINILFSSHWNQFYPIGERIRDYALLSDQLRNILSNSEPWMSGTHAHYYLIWYKIGAVFGRLFFLNTETTYLFLLNFCWSLYFSVIYLFSIIILKQSRFVAILSALLILYSANWAGIIFGFNNSNDWWQISRVIEGAITEFPSWSYLLADLHPHFMNLSMPPLYIFLCFLLLDKNFDYHQKLKFFVLLSALFISFFLNANPWDSLAVVVFAPLFILKVIKDRNKDKNSKSIETKDVNWKYFIGITLLVIILFLMRPEMRAQASLKFVYGDVARTPPYSFFQHWGGWILMIGLLSLFLLGKKIFKRWLLRYWILFVTLLIFLILPEIIYLDDAYVAPYERMNFIFKVYSFSWGIAGLCFLSQLSMLESRISVGILMILLIPCSSFFIKTSNIRLNEFKNLYEPLDTVEQNMPGLKEAILQFRKYPDGISIQSAKSAYDYTSFLSTMSDKTLYLGWANHIQLLSGEYSEIAQRLRHIDDLYLSDNCERKMSLFKEINGKYLVISPQEMKDYPQINLDNFSCFKSLFQNSTVRILSI